MNKKNFLENEVLLRDILRMNKKKIVNVKLMRKLYEDIKLLEKFVVESGKNKTKENYCSIIDSDSIDKCLHNVLMSWYEVKLKGSS